MKSTQPRKLVVGKYKVGLIVGLMGVSKYWIRILILHNSVYFILYIFTKEIAW